MLPLGASVKCISLLTILYAPLNNVTFVESLWFVDELPMYPLSPWINGKVPKPLIGPVWVVPNPTFVILINSSSIFKISWRLMVDIPDKLKIVDAVPMDPVLLANWWTISVWAIGCWTKPSIVINALVNDLDIANWWSLPSPTSTKVTALPPLVVDIENISSLSFIAKTVVGNVSVFPEVGLYIIGVDPTPTKDACGV